MQHSALFFFSLILNKIRISSFLLGNSLGEPVESFEETFSTESTGSLDEPFTSSETCESEFLGDLSDIHHTLILLVGEDQKCGFFQVVFGEHSLEFFLGDLDTLLI